MPAISTHHRDALSSAIKESQPFQSGTIPVSDENLILYYGKEQIAHRLDFTNPTEANLDHLFQCCNPATFGLNQQDVLDESYRKARKLDLPHFASTFDLERTGLLRMIMATLMGHHGVEYSIRAEQYKLNVYGKDSFFKAHKDTPRAQEMFGSLVIIFPTPHEGGSLVLRDKDQEWIFDSAKEVSETPGPCVGYIAFYSDVEHEVTRVTSGYRVTLTYNLYLSTPVDEKSGVELIDRNSKLMRTLTELLHDPSFLPTGGVLGFGLSRQYPAGSGARELMTSCLKGSDAILQRSCSTLGLATYIRLFFSDIREWGGASVLCSSPPQASRRGDSPRDEDFFLSKSLRDEHNAKAVEVESSTDQVDISVSWITPLPERAMFEEPYVHYGNESTLGYDYWMGCLIVEVGPFGNRTSEPGDRGDEK